MTGLRLLLDLVRSPAFWRGATEGMMIVSVITFLSILVWIVMNLKEPAP